MAMMTGMKLDMKNRERNDMAVAGFRNFLLAAFMAAMISAVSADELAGLMDPTQPLFGAAAAVAAQKPASSGLQSTFISAGQRRAVINGRTYKMGDKFSGGVITDIQPYEVVLKRAGGETRLRLLPRLAKQMHMVKVPVNSHEGGHK